MVRLSGLIGEQLLVVAAWLKRGRSRLWPRRGGALGQGLVEYALMLVLIAVVVIGSLTILGGRTSRIFDEIQCRLSGGTMHEDRGNGNSNRCR